MSYNLVVEAWIPVLYRNGEWRRVGIRRALEESGRIRQIAASNPLDNVSLLRFLLAVLMWCKPDAKTALAALDANATGIPGDWLGKLNEHGSAFELLGDGDRFYQDRQTPNNSRPIGDLLVEFPTETNIVHFRHVRDKAYGLCPACCALGIVRFCCFANAYGGGRYHAAVNGPTAAYVIAQGSTLLDTLRQCWPADETQRRKPPWMCADPPSKGDLDVPTVFAWRSRRLWLGCVGGDGTCAHCGERHALIRDAAFTGHWKPPFETIGQQKKFWDQDPHLIIVEKSRSAGEDDDQEEEAGAEAEPKRRGKKGTQKTTLGFPSPGSKVSVHSKFWRRVIAARPGNGTLLVAGPAANKGLYQDAAVIRLPAVEDTEAVGILGAAMDQVGGALRRSTPNPDRRHPERTAALDALSPELEAHLRNRMAEAPKEAASREGLEETVGPIVDHVVMATTPGSSLRRREAGRRAQAALGAVLQRATAPPQAKPAGAATAGEQSAPAKPKRPRQKKGDSE